MAQMRTFLWARGMEQRLPQILVCLMVSSKARQYCRVKETLHSRIIDKLIPRFGAVQFYNSKVESLGLPEGFRLRLEVGLLEGFFVFIRCPRLSESVKFRSMIRKE